MGRFFNERYAGITPSDAASLSASQLNDAVSEVSKSRFVLLSAETSDASIRAEQQAVDKAYRVLQHEVDRRKQDKLQY